MKQITPQLFSFTGLLVGQVYLIQDADGLTLVDTGMSSAAPKILKQLRQAGYQPSDVKRIVITHAHPDHVGGLPALKQVTGAEVIASGVERPVIEGRQPIPRVERDKATGIARWGLRPPNTTLRPTPVDREANDSDTLPEVMGGMRVVGLPGHAPGQIGLWHEGQGLLICGDAIMRFMGNLRVPLSFLTYDMVEARHSIRRIADMDPALLCFGHGDPLTENTSAAVRSFARVAGVLN